MAPEVLLSDDYDCECDIWSLGITAYELAVGEPPHAALHSMRAALKIPSCEPPVLPVDMVAVTAATAATAIGCGPQQQQQQQQFRSRWSPDFHSFLAACCVKDPKRRPSAVQLLLHPFIQKAMATQPQQQLQQLVELALADNRLRRQQQGGYNSSSFDNINSTQPSLQQQYDENQGTFSSMLIQKHNRTQNSDPTRVDSSSSKYNN